MNFYEYQQMGFAQLEAIHQSHKPLVLYGAGSIGNFMGAILGDLVEAYCITQGAGPGEQFNGKPLYNLKELPFEPSGCQILLTLDARHWTAVQGTLLEMGFGEVIEASVDWQNALLAVYYHQLFQREGVDLSEDMILIKGTYIRNPLKLSAVDLKAVLIEMNDLILGDLFNDYRLWSEGPYLYGGLALEPGDVVFDCGANLGLFSCIAAAKNCTSYAFEPTKRLYEALDHCVKAYPQHVVPVNMALSNQCGTAVLSMSSDWDVANTIIAEAENTIVQTSGYTMTEEVATTTIDAFVEARQLDRVDFIKADIEGAERLMLAGARETLKKFAPKLSICTYHFKDDPEVLEALILEANPKYHVTHKWKKLYAYVPK